MLPMHLIWCCRYYIDPISVAGARRFFINFQRMKPQILLRSVLLIALIFSLH
jgi:hypothetical protein